MYNESTIKSLEALRDDFYSKYKSVDDTINLMKGTLSSGSAKSNSNVKFQSEMISDGYDTSWPMKLKMSHILKKEGRFLHIRQIAAFLHGYEPSTSEKDFITKLYPAIAELKKANVIVKVAVDNSNLNTFWGSKNWLDNNGIITEGHAYDADQIKNNKADVIEI